MTTIKPTIVRPPKIPSKYDIIPIHASDRGTFKRCKRKWDWSSPMRNNYVPKVTMQGIDKNLWFGSGVHWSLAQYYNPVLKRDPVEAFIVWWDMQMNGGTIADEDAEFMDQIHDRDPIYDEVNKAWRVRGLFDLLPTDDFDVYLEHRQLGIDMLTFYKDYAEENDNFAVICEEHTFSIPVITPDGNVLIAVDPRDGKPKEVHLRGTQDGIIQDLETGLYGILEHKSAIRIDENYHRKLEKDEQCTTYMYAAEKEAEFFGIEYEKISFVLYNAMRKAAPRPPTETSKGLFSINRATESTTIQMLEEFIDRKGIQIIVDADPKLSSYVDYVREAGDKQFIERNLVRRNRAEIISCGDRIYMEVLDMLDPNIRIYPNPTGDFLCLNCVFRAPCIAADDGSDPDMILTDLYQRNWSR